MAKHIIGIAGEMASGKDTVTAYLVERYGARQFRFSDPLRTVLRVLHKEVTRDNLTAVSVHLRAAFGQDLLAHVIEQEAVHAKEDIVVIDGVRRLSDIDLVKDRPEFILLYTETDLQTRYDRLHKRGQNDDDGTLTFEQFVEDHQNETERGIQGLKQYAALTLENNGTLEELYTKVDAFVATLKNT